MATRAEIEKALRAAHAAGNEDHARILAKAYSELPEEAIREDNSNPYLNAVYGFAARGNEALSALNPFSNKEKIANEKEWVKTHRGAAIGETLADMAITAPIGGIASLPVRVLGTGLIEANTREGNLEDKAKEFGLGSVGAALGEGAASALGFIAKPFSNTNSSARETLKEKAKQLGLKLNAAQETGNKTLQYVDSALDVMPSSSVAQKEFKDAQREQWQKSLFEHGGQEADAASQSSMGDMKKRISDVYNDVSSRNNINMDSDLKNALNNISKSRAIDRMDTNKRHIVQSYLDEFNAAPVGAQFSGKGYQNTRSMLDKQIKSMRNGNPQEAEALTAIRSALDEAMGRSVSAEDAAAWKGANKDWMTMKTIEKGTNPTTEEISPNLIINELKRRNPSSVVYGSGDQTLNDIAKVGKEFIPSKLPDSGTAQRAAAMKFLSGATPAKIAASIAIGDAGFSHDPYEAALSGTSAALASILFPKLAGAAMRKQGGYLSKGLVDLDKEVISGLTRKKLLKEIGRNAGTQTFNQMLNK